MCIKKRRVLSDCFAAAMRQDSTCCCLLDDGSDAPLISFVASDVSAGSPRMMKHSSLPSFSGRLPPSCCLLLTPPLPTPHSKFSLCSFTIRSVRSRPACRAQDSMEGTITHSLSNSDAKSVPAVGGRRLHFKMLQRQKKKY